MTRQNEPVPQGRIRRTMPLAGFTARAAGGRLLAGMRQRAGDGDAVHRFHIRTAERYTDLLGHSKGALMKAGQILSMVDADALGTGGFSPYQKALARLQADAPPMHPDLVNEVLIREIGSPSKHFAEFNAEPVAAASIGQVHYGVLHDGRRVAVKIQYPGVDHAIRSDLANTELLATFLRFVTAASGMPIDTRAIAHETAERIREEIDYHHEAQMISAFGDLYQGHPFVVIPEVIAEASSRRVLTMTYLEGMGWAAAKNADQQLRDTWAEVIARFINANYRHANLVHADPHPGNYRFRADGTVGFLDFGCVTVLEERARWLWVSFLRAAYEGRIDDCRNLMAQLGFFAVDSSLTDDELRQWVSEMTYEVNLPQPVTYTAQSTARVFRGMVDVRDRNHPVAKITLPAEQAFTSRISLAFASVAAGLNATLATRSILEDMDGVAEPVTELGRLHHGWVRERGLPGALDRHDHP
ncbi:AarF/ABC1/UbiB kinase family protein [Mycobacterium sp. shizuoka-1]|uniref:ABC1 kinase family protein n=1 Tax=Mycobacterium sp. shizuoka-1 TaxID=2039281 RepID=UPI000C05E36F|nr:AarF/ABC1/UbiB kinase family protein [Mycobacterium sp. shizuoka-1]GAY16839.1 putative ABC transporter ATP-binding protein [Mycobacterium sp. shizuoka-1]